MNYRLLHVSIHPGVVPLDWNAIQTRLTDLGRDWLFYNSHCYVLWTDKSTVTVSEMLQGHLRAADQLLVFSIDTDEIPTGRMAPWVWEWINRPRNPFTGDILTPALPAPAATNLFTDWMLPPTDGQ